MIRVSPTSLPTATAPPPAWWHWPVAGLLGLALFGFGQFDEPLFAVLTRGWQGLLGGLGPGAQRLVQPTGLSTHGLLVGLTYRALYVLLSLGLLHVLLRGRYTRYAAGVYGLGLGLSFLLLLLGQRAALPLATEQGHRLLDLLNSPLALLLCYGLLLLRRSAPPGQPDHAAPGR